MAAGDGVSVAARGLIVGCGVSAGGSDVGVLVNSGGEVVTVGAGSAVDGVVQPARRRERRIIAWWRDRVAIFQMNLSLKCRLLNYDNHHCTAGGAVFFLHSAYILNA